MERMRSRQRKLRIKAAGWLAALILLLAGLNPVRAEASGSSGQVYALGFVQGLDGQGEMVSLGTGVALVGEGGVAYVYTSPDIVKAEALQYSFITGSTSSGYPLTMTAQVASTTVGRYESYTLECVSGPEGCTVSVLEPAELAGVTASFDADMGLLSYDSLVLSFETPEDVTPITALPVLVSALRDAYETISWSEGDDTYVSLEATDELSITLRLGADGNPVWAEFLLGGEAVSQCEITQFTISEA